MKQIAIILRIILIGMLYFATGCGPSSKSTPIEQVEEWTPTAPEPTTVKQEDWILLKPDNEGQTATEICQKAGFQWAVSARRCDSTLFDFPDSYSNENCKPGANTYQDCFNFLGCSHAEEQDLKGVIWDAIFCSNNPPPVTQGLATDIPQEVHTIIPPGGESLCEAAFSNPVTPGTISAPVRTLIHKVYEDRGWENDENTPVVPHIEPWEAAAVNTLLCIREDRTQEITYPDGEAGYRLSWDVRLVQFPGGEVVGAQSFQGEPPPDAERWETMKEYFSPPISGDNPQGSLYAWLFSTLNDRTVFCHGVPVYTIALSADGKTLAVGGSNNLVNLWDAATGELVRTLTLSPDQVYVDSLAFSPDGTAIALPGEFVFPPQPIRLWHVASGEAGLAFKAEDILNVSGLAFSPNGKTLASGDWDGKVYLWDATTGLVLQTLSGHSDMITSLAFSPDGTLLASGSLDKTVRIWDSTGQLLRTLSDHTDSVNNVAFSPDGKILASGSDDNSVILTEVATGQTVARLSGEDHITAVAFSPDGRIVALSDVSTIKLWDWAANEILSTLSGHTKAIKSLLFLPDGQTLVSGSIDTTIKLWEIETGP